MMSEMDTKSTLGLPPIELAEFTITAPAQRVSFSSNLYRKCMVLLSSKACKISIFIGVVVIGLIILLRLLPLNENVSDMHQTQILIVTGTRQPINDTIPVTNITVFVEIKDKTTNTTVKRNKRSNKEKDLEKFNIPKGREVIMNNNETCDPSNVNQFCKNILKKLNVTLADENENPGTENRKFRDIESDEILVTSGAADVRLSNPGGTAMDSKSGYGSKKHPANIVDYTLNNSARSATSHISSPPIHTRTYSYPYAYQGPYITGPTGLPQYPGHMNYYGVHRNPNFLSMNPYNLAPGYHPYTSPGLINPYLHNGQYKSFVDPLWPSAREATSTALDESQHPQDVSISIHYKDSLPAPSGREPNSLTACPPGAVACELGGCVLERQWCDGAVDCGDASDEAACECRRRVDASRLCDGYHDCPLGEDEMGCFGCSEHEFSCEDIDLNSKSTCFEKDQRCNNVVDCRNSKDEVECNMLAPSLHEKPVFAVSHTEGYLHRNFMGKWYPVCENPYMWAHDACRRETGLLLRPPFIQLTPVDPLFKGHYINNVHGDLFHITDNCANSSAVYVTCQDLLCGTRVQTTSQILRENADFENRLFGRNKRNVDFAKASLNPNKATIDIEQPPPPSDADAVNRRSKDISQSRPSLKTDENYSDFEAKKYLTELNYNWGAEIRENRTKGDSLGSGRDKRAEGRVVGGRPSQPAAWPWMVAIYKDGVFHCGGVIISNRWILSAAHCVHSYWEHYYEVQVGMLRRFSFSPQEQNHRVTHVVSNQRYNRADMRNDLSLLRVAPALQFSRWVRPVCLPAPHTAGPRWSRAPDAGTICTAVGWGATVERGPDPDHMREVEVPVWNSCKHRQDRAGREICAGLIEGGKDACQGDSGGPLLCKNPLNSRQWYMAGIVSHGDGCGRKGEPGVYTRVSLYVEWIQFYLVSRNLPTIRPKQDCPGFRCFSGISKCLPKKRFCDKIVDCLNAEDEIQCHLTRSAEDNDSFVSMSTIRVQNETQLQSTITGETTPLNGVKGHASLAEETTPELENRDKIKENPATDGSFNAEEIQQNSQIPDQPRHRPQTNTLSSFNKDTEDLLSGPSNIMHYTSTEKQITGHDARNMNLENMNDINHFKSVDDTTPLNIIDSNVDLEVDPIVKKIHSKAAAAMSSKKLEFPMKPSITHLNESSESKISSSNQEMFRNNDANEMVTAQPMNQNNEIKATKEILKSTSSSSQEMFRNNDADEMVTAQPMNRNNEIKATKEILKSTFDNDSMARPLEPSILLVDHATDANHTSSNPQNNVDATVSNITKILGTENDFSDKNESFTNKDNINIEENNGTTNSFNNSGNHNSSQKETENHIENKELAVDLSPSELDHKNIDALESEANANEINIETESSPINQDKEKVEIVEESNLHPNSTNELSSESQDGENKSLDVELPSIPEHTTSATTNIIMTNEEEKNISPVMQNLLIPAQVKKIITKHSIFECLRITQIIPYNLRCNHQADCEDGTDELECTCVDYLTHFNSYLICDGVMDCADGLDETDCYECDHEDHFLCKYSNACLPVEYVCDGKPHCSKGEDELDCFALTNGAYMHFDIDGRPHVNVQGFLTMRRRNSWNVVCEDNINLERQEEAATHICHYLGFSDFNAFSIKHINIPDEHQPRAGNDTKSKRDIKREKIKFIHQYRQVGSEDSNDFSQKVIHDPEVLPVHCVPNVIKTCMTLFVTCFATLNSNISSHKLIPSQPQTTLEATKTSNEILDYNTEYLWPWEAKVYIEGEYRCTGVLIELSWVLTSDSCLWDALLTKDYVCVVLGSKRTLAATNGPYEQIFEVDGKKDIFDSHVTLLHLTKPATFTRMVKPMVMPAFNLHRTDSEACVAVGQGRDNRTVTVLLHEVDSDCGRRKRCFVRHGPRPACSEQTYSGNPWAGIISCRLGGGGGAGGEGGGWFPAASYTELSGECGFLGRVTADSLAHLRTDFKNAISAESVRLLGEHATPACEGVRCARGACVRRARVCDAVRDCEDGGDEDGPACEQKFLFCRRDPHDTGCMCDSGQLKCANGRCIGKQLFANGQDECGDGSDEPARATCAQYLARVAPQRLCDGRLHCRDRSDEDPHFCKCFSTNTEPCHQSDSCVALDLVCDGVRDCPHGEDEASCTGLAAPDGTSYGTGEVIVRRYGVWHTKCYHTPNHTRSELEGICRKLGFLSGHAKLLKSTALPSMNPNTELELDNFSDITLNQQTKVFLRSNDRPMARAVVGEAAESCYPVYIECV